MRMLGTTKPYRSQNGTTLVVSLIILLVLTVLGITSMDTSTMNIKMVSSYKDRAHVFEGAEVALASVEEMLNRQMPHTTQMITSCQNTGMTNSDADLKDGETETLDECFNTNCDNGLCFSGEYDDPSSRNFCASAPPDLQYWKDTEIWDDATRHRTVSVVGLDNPVKYIVEFLCYTTVNDSILYSRGEGVSGNTESSNNNGFAHLYRISTSATGNGNKAQAFLQSYYRVALLSASERDARRTSLTGIN